MNPLSKPKFLALWERDQFRKKAKQKYDTINQNKFDDREHLAYVSDKYKKAAKHPISEEQALRSKYL
ncbi:MAG: hypothetical protein WCS30_11995 [Selenomonadaceae bacterium]